MNYQRMAARVATSLLGTIEFQEALSTCLVTELSSSGARLRVSPSKSLPSTFCVRISRLGLAKQVTLRWREGEDAGVEFQSCEVLRLVPAERMAIGRD